ncbi:NADPH-dependent FMN reductase [Shewanella denitrificans OS217]|uniref:NADPH-dependent FMN reductase n=1 Tax=Shewanella denitrificans (strain OS217 / ATCC BAA-1090 / DSM 15013) TaxID=318161 RepID=Q12PB9_SHEDO|nr:flavodoxin family protein [Shewanella denitrificans]ABE54707.1 NADPH-dependent FMN reductase [Shewanella denitrificans OS217]
MVKIAVIYHSVTGTTKQLANSVTAGASSVEGIEVIEVEILGADIIEGRFKNLALLEQLKDVDAMIFGSPTFMGSVSAQFKAFADATGELWAEKAWSDKVAAGFTIGSNLSGDQLHTLQYLQIFANQHGMLWASLDIPGNCDPQKRNRLGAQSGLIAHSKDGILNEIDLNTAHYLGQRVAHIVKKFAR